MRAAWLLLLAAGTALAADGQPVIGRLFGPAGTRPGAEGSGASARLGVDGAVARSAVAGTVWINGAAVSRSGGAVRAEARLERMPEITLLAPASRPAPARVGETLEMEANHRTDLVPRGAIAIRRVP